MGPRRLKIIKKNGENRHSNRKKNYIECNDKNESIIEILDRMKDPQLVKKNF